jgi:DNA polymerase (family 10)
MVETARAIGLEYLGVSDHLRSERHPEGLDAAGEAEQFQEIASLRREFPDFDLLHGLEVDASSDGSVDLPPEVLEHLDYVIVSLPEPDGHTKDGYTEAALKVIRHPEVDVISRPVGGYMLTKPPVPLDMMRVLKAAAETGTVVEVDANPASNDLDGTHCRLAADLGVTLAINPNAHRAARLVDYRQGVQIARDMGLDCRQFVNVLTAAALRDRFNRRNGG